MKKKLLVLCLVVMFVLPATVFAGSFLGLKVGAAAILNEDINLEDLEATDFSAIGLDSFSFGADVRFNVSIAELSSVIQGQMDGDYLYLYGYAGLGLSLELLGLVDLGITAGPMLGAIVDTATGDMISSFDFEDPENMDLIVRATADVNLGGISVGGFVMVSPGLSIANIMDPAFDPSTVTVPTTATVGLSVLLALL